MKITFAVLLLSAYAFGQGENSQRAQNQPSHLMTATIPAQTVTITVDLTSELATALEKRRIDSTHPVTNADGTVSMETSPTIGSQLGVDIQRFIFEPLLKAYPPASAKVTQDAAAAAQTAHEEKLRKAATAKITAK